MFDNDRQQLLRSNFVIAFLPQFVILMLHQRYSSLPCCQASKVPVAKKAHHRYTILSLWYGRKLEILAPLPALIAFNASISDVF